MMPHRPNWNPTVVLWAGNAAVWLLLALIVVYQFGLLSHGGGAPKLRTLAPEPIQPSAPLSDIAARNPFDPNGNHWRTTAAVAAGSVGELRGVILLPGVRAAITGGGLVPLGGQWGGGRVTGIDANKVIVQRQGAVSELELPSAHRPTLQSLNRNRRSDTAEPEKGAR